jgi:hypothetical protein
MNSDCDKENEDEDTGVECEGPNCAYDRLANMTARVGESKARSRRTMESHLNKFLQDFPIRNGTNGFFSSFDELPERMFDSKCEFIGKFSAFIRDHVPTVKKQKSHRAIVSCLHVAIYEKFPSKEIEMKRHYTLLCKAIESYYLEQSELTEIDVVNHSTLISNEVCSKSNSPFFFICFLIFHMIFRTTNIFAFACLNGTSTSSEI